MLSEQQFDFFNAFGFLTLSADLPETRDLPLHEEMQQALSEAYDDGAEGTLFLPVMGDSTPHSVELIHHPMLWETAGRLLDTAPIVKPAKVSRFTESSAWHRDCYSDHVRGIKYVIYLGTEQESPIQFDVVPGSHSGLIGDYVEALLGCAGPLDPNSGQKVAEVGVPVRNVTLLNGQLLMFDIRLWHANYMVDDRLQWSVTYLAEPNSEIALPATVEYLGDFLSKELHYPKEQFPYFPALWESNESKSPLSLALHRSGVMTAYLDLFGLGR